jgi:hypothetical protein
VGDKDCAPGVGYVDERERERRGGGEWGGMTRTARQVSDMKMCVRERAGGEGRGGGLQGLRARCRICRCACHCPHTT